MLETREGLAQYTSVPDTASIFKCPINLKDVGNSEDGTLVSSTKKNPIFLKRNIADIRHITWRSLEFFFFFPFVVLPIFLMPLDIFPFLNEFFGITYIQIGNPSTPAHCFPSSALTRQLTNVSVHFRESSASSRTLRWWAPWQVTWAGRSEKSCLALVYVWNWLFVLGRLGCSLKKGNVLCTDSWR